METSITIFDKFQWILEQGLKDEILTHGKSMRFTSGEVIIHPERYVKTIPLVLQGAIKVLRQDAEGHELFLYYLKTGQSCAVSLGSCLMEKTSNIKAVAEEETEILAIPSAIAGQWFEKYPSWRNFVVKTLNERFEELIKTIDNIAFHKTDERLMNFLAVRVRTLGTTSIHITHQEIANELSTSREVISRLLKQMESNGMIKLHRNWIEIFFPV
ncbi:MAG: Crp/Fnr family transcriptional regulator [Cytophagales bacterium]|nr:Crp/Fnr family transcriptional regulator [Cytophagales bacterium]